MRHLIALGEQAKVTIIEEYIGATEIEYFMNVVSEFSSQMGRILITTNYNAKAKEHIIFIR